MHAEIQRTVLAVKNELAANRKESSANAAGERNEFLSAYLGGRVISILNS